MEQLHAHQEHQHPSLHAIEVMLKRRSIRKFKPDPVPWDNIVSMVNCGLTAPCAGNVHNVKCIVVQDPSNRKAVAKACYEQLWMASAPCLIAIVAEPEHQRRVYGTRGEKLYTIQNGAAYAMSIIIAAESLGLGTCWVGAFDEDSLRGALGMPEYVNVHVILAVGFPDEHPKSPAKPMFRSATYREKWWASGKNPSYGYYSQNVMKTVKKTGDAIQQVAEKILGRKPESKDKGGN